MIFSKSHCPYCKAAKELLNEILKDEKFSDVRMDVVELDKLQNEDGSKIQAYLAQMTGQRTVPNIFIDSQHVGGNADLQEKHDEGVLVDWILSSLDDEYDEGEDEEEEEEL